MYAKAVIPPTDKVGLWLGANVMMEYNMEEAIEMLNCNIKNAKNRLLDYVEDIEFLKDQITTTEVNIARCHNHKIKLGAAKK